MARRRSSCSHPALLVLALLALASSLPAEAPPLPSSLFGLAISDGAPVPPGQAVSAWSLGELLAGSVTYEEAGESRFRLDIPGDLEETPGSEGAVEGEIVEIRLGSTLLARTPWHSGEYKRIDLSVAAGPDLSVVLANGSDGVEAGEALTYGVTVRNHGEVASRGVALAIELPSGSTVLSASDGGAASATGAYWPAFDLLAEETQVRTLSVRVGQAFAAGVEVFTVIARVADDSSAGLDPEAANNEATDVDALDAAPDLALALSDGRTSARPGDTLVYRAAISNHGTQGASGGRLEVELPAATELYSTSHGGALTGSVVAWPDLAVAAGETVERTLTVRFAATLGAEVAALAVAGQVADDGANGPELGTGDNQANDIDAIEHAADLLVEAVDAAALVTDTQTLELSGAVEVVVENRGSLPSGPFALVAFSDSDGDAAYTAGVDALLGQIVATGLAAGERDVLSLTVAGTARFRGDRVFAMADAERVVEEWDESNNVGDSSRGCEATPSGLFAPTVERRWPLAGGPSAFARAIDSLSTPLVVQLTDDNGDGLWNASDVPDLVFVTTDLVYTLEPMVALRAVRGDSLAPIFDVNGIFPQPILPVSLSFSGLAAADIDHDGKPEIVSTTFIGANRLVAFEHTGAIKWQSAGYRTHPIAGRSSRSDNPTIADLDGDGETEIVVGANVFDRFGRLLWRGTGGQAFQSAGNRDDHRSGAISAVADVDLDGRLEVVTGNTLYRADGTIVWQVELPDGFPAVGNFDADPEPEIVVVARGSVRLHDADGSLIWGPYALPGSDPEAGGAPTVGDFDGDGAPEIGVAGSDAYVVYETDGTIRWQATTQDYTSNFTGSTLFDFDGDGAMEVVYRDERRLWLFAGRDGAVLAQLPVSSDTWTEEPVVADVDGDGNAEIVVASDRALDVAIPAGERTAGLFIVGDASDGWVAAREMWNQHAYTPELVADDASVPANPAWSWLAHNSFRANAPPPGGALGAADLTASRVRFELAALPQAQVTVRIGNGGRGRAAAGLEVAVYLGDPAAGGDLVGTMATERQLLPGEFEDLSATFELAIAGSSEIFVVADDDGSGQGRERECDETNNVASATADLTALGLWLTLDDGTEGVGAGDELTYRLIVRNALATAATGVVLTDDLPPELHFVAASDGGVEAAGSVTWPALALASGELAERTVTVRVDPALPLTTTAITNRASVADDGAAGPEPSPENNTAVDVDAVVSATADAGGPYAGQEGSPILLDGSASFDRDGSLVAFEWDFDDDGDFDDGSGPTVSRIFADEGLYRVRLRVRDDAGEVDIDATEVTVVNLAPALSAPTLLEADEGSRLSLATVTVVDGGADALTATIDWGDGTIETVAVAARDLAATHAYADDGSFTIGLCVADGDGGENCASILAAIANVPPAIDESVRFDLLGWKPEELPGGSTVQWSVSAEGATALESRNGRPTVLSGGLQAYGAHEFTVRVSSSGDDDYVGFVLGFSEGELADRAADYLLVDWKGASQSGARVGLAASRVRGTPSEGEFWLHADLDANGSAAGVTELQRGATFGARGWRRYVDYRVRIDYARTRLRVWIDGTLELDLAGDLPAGRVGFYDYSQSGALFAPVASSLAVTGIEGSESPLRGTFTDPGLVDTHLATVDWGDGEIGTARVMREGGEKRGEVASEHVYLDDGDRTIELCVSDDEAGEECVTVPSRVENVAPTLTLDLVSTGFLEDLVHLGASAFADAGLLDVHSATIDWGDGVVEPASIAENGGAGTIEASHFYAATGIYSAELCVDDGDGGITCEKRSLTLIERFLDIAVTKAVTPSEARPNQILSYTLRAENRGSLEATGIVLFDSLPQHLAYVSASGGGTLSGDIVSWAIGTLPPGGSATVTLTAQVAADAPFGAVVVNSATIVDDGSSGPDGRPEDNLATAPVRLGDDATPIVTLGEPLTSSEGLVLGLAGASYGDTATGETHTATIDWGDGSTSVAGLAPASGRSGAISGAHVYAEDGIYAVKICVRDAAGHSGCASTAATILNGPPIVVEPGLVDMRGWDVEQYEASQGSPNWVVAADGLSVHQTENSDPSVLVSPLPAFGTSLEGVIRVATTGDDDFIGFVLGFDPGDATSPDADYLLVDWKQLTQTTAPRGLALSRVTGIPIAAELWAHYDDPFNGSANAVRQLARGLTKGNASWIDHRDYHFRFEYTPNRLRVWVDGTLEFDAAGEFPDGHFGFYNYSQAHVIYRGFLVGLSRQPEGERFDLEAPFTDLGLEDTHEARVDWDDGSSSAVSATAVSGFGRIVATHDYFDDGDYLIEVCATDDDGGADCGRFPLAVFNVAPTVVAAAEASVAAGSSAVFGLATFTDPGRIDSHTATVDWGDAVVEAAEVTEDDGAGEVAATHAYAAAGLYTVTVCVRDDDGGEGCDSTRIAVGSELPMLAAPKTVSAVDRDGDGRVSAGDDLLYEIEVANLGPTTATAVVLTDPVPAHTSLLAESVTPEALVTALEPLTVELPSLAAGSSITVRFAVRIDAVLPALVREIVNSGVVTSAELPPVATDDPTLPGAADPTRISVFAESRFSFTKTAELVDLDGNGVATAGDELAWTLALTNVGSTEAAGLLLRDPLPNDSELTAGSIVTAGLVTREEPVEIVFDRFAVGATETVELRTRIVDPLPRSTTEIANQAELYVGELAQQLSDDPAQPGEADPTVVAVAPIPDLTVGAAAVAEGTAAGSVLRFRLALDVPTVFPVAVDWATADLTALSGEDYLAASGVATFAPGTSEAFVDVALVGDPVVEVDETMQLALSAPSGLRLLTPAAFGTIVNDDRTSFVVADASAEEGEPLTFLVRLSAPSALGAAVDFVTADGSAIAGDDYVAASGRLAFAPFESEKSVAVVTLEDTALEGDETLRLVLSNPAVADLGDSEATGDLLDDDDALLAIDDVEVVEGDEGVATMRFTVALATAIESEVTVDFVAVAESATVDRDFEVAAGTLTLAPGAVTAYVDISVVGDRFFEPDETLRVELANPVGAVLDDAFGVGTIRDDDLCRGPNLLSNGGAEARSWTELLPGWTSADGSRWQRRKSNPSPLAGAACFDAADQATAELVQSVDLAPLAGHIDAGDFELAVSGWVRSGEELPADEARVIVELWDAGWTTRLSSWDSGPLVSLGAWAPFEAELQPGPAVRGLRLRLLGVRAGGEGNDALFDELAVEPLGLATLSVADATTHEDLLPAEARFVVRLSCPLESSVTFGYATTDGSALSPSDYLATAGAATVEPGATETVLVVPVLNDAEPEPAERFTLDLFAVEGAEALDGQGVGTILDGDNCQESQGYWKNHPERWPARSLVVGGVAYDEAGMMWLLSNELTDPTTRLAKQLAATLLNLLSGSDPWILPRVDAAQAFLETYPLGSDLKGEPLDVSLELEDDLKRYSAKCTKQ